MGYDFVRYKNRTLSFSYYKTIDVIGVNKKNTTSKGYVFVANSCPMEVDIRNNLDLDTKLSLRSSLYFEANLNTTSYMESDIELVLSEKFKFFDCIIFIPSSLDINIDLIEDLIRTKINITSKFKDNVKIDLQNLVRLRANLQSNLNSVFKPTCLECVYFGLRSNPFNIESTLNINTLHVEDLINLDPVFTFIESTNCKVDLLRYESFIYDGMILDFNLNVDSIICESEPIVSTNIEELKNKCILKLIVEARLNHYDDIVLSEKDNLTLDEMFLIEV